MLSTYLNSLHEAFAKRMAMVMLGLALLFAYISFRVTDSVPHSAAITKPQMNYVLMNATRALAQSAGIWIMVGVLAVAPLLSSTLEKGWLELMFSKGTSRWEILSARLLAGMTLYLVSVTIASAPVAFWLWHLTGAPTGRIAGAAALECLAFLALLSVAALVSLLQKGPALPIVTAIGVWFFSPVLQERKSTLYNLLTSNFAHWVMDWMYRILPKNDELHTMATKYVQTALIPDFWPIWSTAVFAVTTLVLTMVLLERKSF